MGVGGADDKFVIFVVRMVHSRCLHSASRYRTMHWLLADKNCHFSFALKWDKEPALNISQQKYVRILDYTIQASTEASYQIGNIEWEITQGIRYYTKYKVNFNMFMITKMHLKTILDFW